jgi:hypothetical protein
MLLEEGRVEYLYNFSNERFFFPAVHHSFKFTLLGAQKGVQSDGFWATFRFNPRVAVTPDELPRFLAVSSNLIYFQRESLKRFNPDSLSVMEFQTHQDYETAEKIYNNWPLLGELDANASWSLKFAYEFHMTNDRYLYNTRGLGLPLYEGKMIHQFEAFYSTPRFWVKEEVGDVAYKNKRGSGDDYLSYRLAVRTIARNTDIRTLICSIIPGRVFCGHSLYTEVGQTLTQAARLYVLTIMNSLALDYVLRYKVATNVSLYHLYQLPIPRVSNSNPYFDAIVPRAARLTCTRPAFAALWQEVMGGPWEPAKGATDPAERQRLRDELDAIVAHLYGLSRDDLAHILSAFPLVFPHNAAGQAKKEALLAVYDAFAPVFGRQ